MSKDGKISVYDSKDIPIIKQNLEKLMKDVENTNKEVQNLDDFIWIIDKIYNNDLVFSDKEVITKLEAIYENLNVEPSRELRGLQQFLNSYNELNKKMFKTRAVVEETVELKYAIKTSLIEVLTDMLIKMCKKIKNCFNIVKGLYASHVFYLDVDTKEEYVIPYDRVNIKDLIHFIKRYKETCEFYIEKLYVALDKCELARIDLESKERFKSENRTYLLNKLHSIFVDMNMETVNLGILETLGERLENEKYIDSEVQISKQSAIDEVKANSNDFVLTDVKELEEIRNLIRHYLNTNSHKL